MGLLNGKIDWSKIKDPDIKHLKCTPVVFNNIEEGKETVTGRAMKSDNGGVAGGYNYNDWMPGDVVFLHNIQTELKFPKRI